MAVIAAGTLLTGTSAAAGWKPVGQSTATGPKATATVLSGAINTPIDVAVEITGSPKQVVIGLWQTICLYGTGAPLSVVQRKGDFGGPTPLKRLLPSIKITVTGVPPSSCIVIVTAHLSKAGKIHVMLLAR